MRRRPLEQNVRPDSGEDAALSCGSTLALRGNDPMHRTPHWGPSTCVASRRTKQNQFQWGRIIGNTARPGMAAGLLLRRWPADSDATAWPLQGCRGDEPHPTIASERWASSRGGGSDRQTIARDSAAWAAIAAEYMRTGSPCAATWTCASQTHKGTPARVVQA